MCANPISTPEKGVSQYFIKGLLTISKTQKREKRWKEGDVFAYGATILRAMIYPHNLPWPYYFSFCLTHFRIREKIQRMRYQNVKKIAYTKSALLQYFSKNNLLDRFSQNEPILDLICRMLTPNRQNR